MKDTNPIIPLHAIHVGPNPPQLVKVGTFKHAWDDLCKYDRKLCEQYKKRAKVLLTAGKMYYSHTRRNGTRVFWWPLDENWDAVVTEPLYHEFSKTDFPELYYEWIIERVVRKENNELRDKSFFKKNDTKLFLSLLTDA